MHAWHKENPGTVQKFEPIIQVLTNRTGRQLKQRHFATLKIFGGQKKKNKLHNMTDHQSCHHLLHLHWRVAPQTSQWRKETGQSGSDHPRLHSGWTCLFSPSEKLIWNQCFIHHKPSIIHLYSCRYWYLYILLFIAYLYYSVQKPIAEV